MSTSRTVLEVPGYQVMQYLGSGARSTIWQIKDCRTEKVYALKRVVKRDAKDVRFLEQAITEHHVSTHMDHPNLRKIIELRRLKRWLNLKEVHLVMEYCPGVSVQDDRPRSIQDVVRIFSAVADALAHMNARGFVHADIKPNNIIVAPTGVVKVIDLGQSCRIGTVKERIQGTPDFIAPEQVRRRPLDSRTDVYNFGAALYWTLVGRPIPTVLPTKGVATMMSDLAIKPPEEVNPDVPAPLSKLVQDCVELRPARRPKSMADVVSRMGLIHHTMNRSQDELAP